MTDAPTAFLCAIVFLGVASAGFALFVVWRVCLSVITRLELQWSQACDRMLNIADFHLQAKREEWEGRNAQAAPAPGRRVSIDPEPEVLETAGAEMNWSPDVSAVSANGSV